MNIKSYDTHKEASYNLVKIQAEIVDMTQGTDGERLSLDEINERWNDDDK